MAHIQNSVEGTMSSAHLGFRFAQELTNQSECSQRGSISTSSGQREVDQQNPAQVGSEGTGFGSLIKNFISGNLFSKKSGGSSASASQDPALASSAPKAVKQTPFIKALQTLVSLSDEDFPGDQEDLANFTKSCSRQDAGDILQALTAAGEDYDKNLCTKDHLGNLHRKAGAPTLVQHLKAALRHLLDRANETGVLENSRSKVASNLINPLVEEIQKNVYPINLRNFFSDNGLNATDEDLAAISGAVNAAISDEHDLRSIDQDQKTELCKELKALIETTASSEAEEVSTPVNKKPNAFERTKQANLYIGTYNQAIDSLIGLLINDSTSLANLENSIPSEIKNFDKLLIVDTIDTYTSEGVDKVIEKLRGLKREDQSIFDKSNKYVARLFAKPLVDFGKPEFVQLRGGSFLGKVKHFATEYVFHNISEFARKPIIENTENTFSRRLERFIQDKSHGPWVRGFAAGLAVLGGALNVAAVAIKTFLIIAAAAILQFVAFTLTAAAVLAIPTGLIALCVLHPYIGVPVLFGICVLVLFANQYKLSKQVKELEAQNQHSLKLLESLEKRLRVSPETPVDSSKRGSLDADAGQNDEAALQNPRRVSAASSKSQSGSNTPRSVNEDGAPLDEDVVQIAAGQNADADADRKLL